MCEALMCVLSQQALIPGLFLKSEFSNILVIHKENLVHESICCTHCEEATFINLVTESLLKLFPILS